MIKMRLAQERGVADLGWLNSRHTFSFGHYFDPEELGFSSLLVINEDRVQPGQGFGQHPHANMEIFSYVLDGALEHKDSMGTGSVIRPGDVQMMSAGSGITHSEFNHSLHEEVHFLQFWIVPNRNNVTPRYQQIHIADNEKRGAFKLIISPAGIDGSLSVYQDVRVYAGLFNEKDRGELSLAAGRYAYIHIARGEALINGQHFRTGDGARVYDERELLVTEGHDAEILVFDLVAKELPER